MAASKVVRYQVLYGIIHSQYKARGDTIVHPFPVGIAALTRDPTRRPFDRGRTPSGQGRAPSVDSLAQNTLNASALP